MKTYTVLVIGDKPEEQMELFNCNAKVDKYIKYYIIPSLFFTLGRFSKNTE